MKTMAKFLFTLMFCLGASVKAQSIEASGNVSPIRQLNCLINPVIDVDEAATDFDILTCTINNNLPDFEFHLRIILPGVSITSIKLIEVDGIRGTGLMLPMNKNLVPSMTNNVYDWYGTQTSATVNYSIKIRVDWTKNPTEASANPGINIEM